MNKNQIYSLTQFITNSNSKTNNVFELFNQWVKTEKDFILNYEEAIWSIQYIQMLLTTDPQTIEESQKIDKLLLERKYENGKKEIFQ